MNNRFSTLKLVSSMLLLGCSVLSLQETTNKHNYNQLIKTQKFSLTALRIKVTQPINLIIKIKLYFSGNI